VRYRVGCSAVSDAKSCRAVAYRRVSTQDQAESGLGLAGQLTQIEHAAGRLGLTLTTMYTDAGLSGSLGIDHRPGLADALNFLQRGDVLLVAKRDRIARDAFLAVLVERAVAKKGCRIISAAGEGTETDDPAAIFTRRILDAVSELERSLIAARTRAAMREAKARGQRVGWIPYGSRLATDGRTLTKELDEQHTLRAMHAMRRSGCTLKQIAARLNETGSRTRRNGPWYHQAICQLLTRHPDIT
jgi:DNA invertase Pin-like site-specific DNA recombinase